MNFADRLHSSITKADTPLVAGFDPVLDDLPGFILDAADTEQDDAGFLSVALTSLYEKTLPLLAGKVAGIKVNVAFFEQYGVPGIGAFGRVCQMVRDHHLPLIVDAKRGDIGSTAEAYGKAFLGGSSVRGRRFSAFDCDAITINPFLGFDTLEPFLTICKEQGRGVFVLVKTSNPGSHDLQELKSDGTSITERVARWVGERAGELVGQSGYSSLGAVVGATYPGEAERLRKLMPKNLFLIPGLGAQGGTAQDSIAGLDEKNGGGIVNVSRGLFKLPVTLSEEEWLGEFVTRLESFNSSLRSAITTRIIPS